MKLIKKSLILILILSSLLLLVSCNKSDVPKDMIEIGTEFTSYRFFVPNTWTEDSNGGFVSAKTQDGSSVSLQTMSLNGVFENNSGYVLMIGNVSYSSIDQYFKDSYIKDLESTFSNFSLKEEYTANQTFGNCDRCAKYVYTITTGEIEYTFQQIFTVYGSNMYIFTYTAKTSNYESHLEDVLNIVKNFKF